MTEPGLFNRLEVLHELAQEFIRLEKMEERAGHVVMRRRASEDYAFRKMEECQHRKDQVFKSALLLGFTNYEIAAAVTVYRDGEES